MKQLLPILLAIPMLLASFPPAADADSFEDGLAAIRLGDQQAAFKAFKSAAEDGDERAYGKLGSLYLYGAGTQRDFIAAYVWLGLAADTGDSDAKRFQEAAQSSMTPKQQEEAVRRLEEKISGLKDH